MRKLLAMGVVAAALVVAAPSPSSAGGWVVVSLDSLPTVTTGEDVEVGFTVLRHGVTPESSNDLSLLLVAPDGIEHRFAAAQEGAVGHHVATISVGEAGSYDWFVTSDSGIVSAELGTLDVAAPPSGGGSWTWDVVQWGSASLAVLMAALAGVEALRGRRRDRAVPAAA